MIGREWEEVWDGMGGIAMIECDNFRELTHVIQIE
jgi:hypothetical protein